MAIRLLGSFSIFVLATVGLSADSIDFQRDIAPIFEEHCSYCHGEDEQESGLRLDRRVSLLRGGDYGQPAVVPKRVDKSYLIDVVTHSDAGMEMPPDEERLPDEKISLLKRWIEQGAAWPGQMDQVVEEELEHWSFQPLRDHFAHDSVDGFLRERLTAAGLSSSEPADPRSLIRRVSIVLTGLAPTPERTAAFMEDHEREPERAYTELVEELLGSPHFGERWAQHWLDVIRWAETNGSESNLYRKNAWMYRDYVVEAFNEDKPYDQFVREQLAGDLSASGEATGFLVAGPHVPSATVGAEPSARRQARADRMDEILQTVGASVMGMTVGCARCHNHKFDPISIQDYYAMSAVFQDVEFGSRFPELPASDPRVIRQRELKSQLDHQRQQLRRDGGAWIEDWTGYQEIHFPSRRVERLRIAFAGRTVLADELEIIETPGNDNASPQNVALASFGTTIVENPATINQGMSAKNLVNNAFGAKEFKATAPADSPERPWVEFHFPKPVSIDRIRISSNREDYLETDFVQGLHRIQYGEFRLETQDESGKWKPFCSTSAMKQRAQEDQERRVAMETIDTIIAAMQTGGPQPAFVARFIDPVDTFVLSRGSPENPRDQVFAAAPSRFDGELAIPPDAPGPVRRKAFADWLVHPDNPLTARVITNRVWHHVFGSGIVATPSDFGEAGAEPTHPKLLDWLAVGMIESGWSIKQLIRRLVLSQAFRQSSLPREIGLAKDASTQLLWRFPPRRVEAEVIRDSILQASGTLDVSIGGPSYRIHNVKKRYAQWEVVDNHGRETWRRMLYQERMRRVDDQIFTAFDFPDCGQIKAKRPVSTTPLQALNLMNSDFVVTQSEILAQRAAAEVGQNLVDQVGRCFELLLCRDPTEAERKFATEFAQEQGLELLCRTLINTNELAFVP